MELNAYQKLARSTALYNEGARRVNTLNYADKTFILRLFYTVTKLNGESGEVAELVAKAMRDSGGLISDERREQLIKELGDVLWYVAAMATELEITLNELAERNVAKLAHRKEQGTIHGSGSDR